MTNKEKHASYTKVALLAQKVKILERNYSQLDRKIDSILTNHLPHIDKKLVGLETRINVMTAINVGAILIGIILNYVFK